MIKTTIWKEIKGSWMTTERRQNYRGAYRVDCELPFVPHEGMSMTVKGVEDTVRNSHYDVDDGRLIIWMVTSETDHLEGYSDLLEAYKGWNVGYNQ